MKLGILGLGYVGNAIKTAYEAWGIADIKTYDPYKNSNCSKILEVVQDSDYIFVCVPTPMKKYGKSYASDFSIVKETCDEIDYCAKNKKKDTCIILKSTTLPSVVQEIRTKLNKAILVTCPEFLSRETAEMDVLKPKRVIYGCDNTDIAKKACADLSERFLQDRTKYYIVGLEEAMKIKYAANAFGAYKVLFFNILHKWFGSQSSYEGMVQALLDSGWVSEQYTKVPGSEGFGYDGPCFPKDTLAFIEELKNANLFIESSYLYKGFQLNEHIRRERNNDEDKA